MLIIGGGVIGLTTALRLAEQGTSVTVVDRKQIGQEASWAGAGMLPPGNPATAATPEARLRSYSHTLWEDLSARLLEQTGIDNGFRICGAVELFDSDNPQSLESQTAAWDTECIRYQILERHDTASEQSPRIEQLVPGLADTFSRAVLLPDFAQARNPRHLKALAAACRMSGVEIVEHADDLQLTVGESGIAYASTADRRFNCERICVTAGSWSGRLLESVGIPLPVKPVRGQIAQLQVPQLPFKCVIELGRRYLVPRPDGLILIGSTEDHVGFAKQNTTEGVNSLLSFAASLVPELADAEVVRTWAGLRPGSPDELPFLGRLPGTENLFVGAGHFRSGLQMSPGTGQILADLLLDKPPAISLDGLGYDRISDITQTHAF
jgi:glycine oxidase